MKYENLEDQDIESTKQINRMIEFINKDSQHKVKLVEEKTKEEVMAL